MSVKVLSECALSKKPMLMEIDSDMNCSCEDEHCNPMIFVPKVDMRSLTDPNIIDAF